jgi:hypothetical protein
METRIGCWTSEVAQALRETPTPMTAVLPSSELGVSFLPVAECDLLHGSLGFLTVPAESLTSSQPYGRRMQHYQVSSGIPGGWKSWGGGV